MRKKLDPRIQALIANGVRTNHRSFFVMVGDRGRDNIVNLHYLLSQARKREAKIKRDIKRGIREANEQDPFELFVAVTDIRYAYYKDSAKILGQTFGMLVLQDYEAITPNLLARTIETVEGGGIVVLLLKTMSSLKQLYAMSMDVHARYRTDAHQFVKPRFNERFILSLGSNPDCLVLDDELNVLPISKGKDIGMLGNSDDDRGRKKKAEELKDMKEDLDGVEIVGPLAKLTKTVDQAKALLTFVEAISEKTLSSTVALTAGRGRGKSAALGLAIGAALAHDYSNIFVTSPDPENLKTLFEFVFKALDALGYEEHIDYDVVQSTNPEFKKAIVRVNVFRGHRQTIQYIAPEDAHVLGQAELVIIDEAAAIPLPLVRKLIGPYLVFMASTISGYEGTGRSLSLKLIEQLRTQTRPTIDKDGESNGKTTSRAGAAGQGGAGLVRSFRDIKLDEPIRYAPGDEVEKWLNHLLCLDASVVPKAVPGSVHPSECELYYVNRDTLFSYHPASEVFLQRMMALYVASHYKNSPNDLQMLSDAPAHHLFVLLPPLKEDDTSLPEPLVVIQVALEGNISREVILKEMAHSGTRSSGDMIPWVISQQFQDNDFAMLSGARVVRIATHPSYIRGGYGARALEALDSFYSGKLTDVDAVVPDAAEDAFVRDSKISADASLATDTITIRDAARMPPLLQRLSERAPEALDYLGVSFGLTPDLFRFWKRAGYVPLYASQKENPLTGEYTLVMLRALSSTIAEAEGWLGAFATDFRQRFLNLLSYDSFKKLSSKTALSVVDAATREGEERKVLSSDELNALISPFDMKRLESYADSMVDYHMVLDLVPTIAMLIYSKRLPDLGLSYLQQTILVGMGLQRKSLEVLSSEFDKPSHQILANFGKLLRRITKVLQDIHRAAMEESEPVVAQPTFTPAVMTVEEDIKEAEREERARVADGPKSAQRELLDTLDMREYAINTEADFSTAEKQVRALATAAPQERARLNTTVSIKGAAPVEEPKEKQEGKKEKRRESTGGAGGKRKKAKRD
ncbi:unnamed protein product [Cutaneotrichosporon oleaginosum]